MAKNYLHIDQENIQETFHEIISKLDIPYIDYIAIAMVNRLSQKSIALMSDHAWADTYYKEDRPEYDPVRKLALTTSNNIIIFDKIPLQSDAEAELMDLRKQCGIYQGFMLIERHKHLSTHLTIGSGNKSFDAAENLLNSYIDYQNLLSKLEKLIEYKVKILMPELFEEVNA